MYEDILFGQEQTSDNKFLTLLEEKLIAYIQELPVLGFNSVRPGCYQRIPVPVLNQASSYQVHREKKH